MAYPGYTTPQVAEPPEAQTVRSMLKIARIVALIFGIFALLGGIGAFVAAIFDPFLIGFGALLVLWFVIDLIIYMQLKGIQALADQHQYEAAKSKSLIWMIIGFILGGIIIGILILVAYLKFDPLITWQRNQATGGMPPAQPMMAPPPPAAPVAGAAAAPPFCPTCGKPTTFVPQYNRYYCYTCNKYV